MAALIQKCHKSSLVFNILRHAASAITCDLIFAKIRISIIIPCPFLAKPHLCLLILCMSKGHKKVTA